MRFELDCYEFVQSLEQAQVFIHNFHSIYEAKSLEFTIKTYILNFCIVVHFNCLFIFRRFHVNGDFLRVHLEIE